ncbi:MAG: head GIN domain-containing protein [Sphingobium sp.]
MPVLTKIEEGRPSWRPFFALKAVGAALMASALAVSAPAHAAMRGFIVTNFDTIRVEAPVRIILTTGTGVRGSGEGERALLDRVKLSVSGGTLIVRMTDGPELDDGAAEVPTIYLSTSQLRRAMVLGGGVLTIKELSGLEADLSMNGNGELIVEHADVDRLSLYVSGGGRMTINGAAKDVRASVNGPGALEAENLVARNATIGNDGVGSAHVTVNGTAKVVSTGSGDTIVDGNAVCDVTRRGIGRILCGS